MSFFLPSDYRQNTSSLPFCPVLRLETVSMLIANLSFIELRFQTFKYIQHFCRSTCVTEAWKHSPFIAINHFIVDNPQ